MKKIYMMALALFAVGTLSAQSNNGDTKTSPKRKTAEPSPIAMPVQKLPKQQKATTGTINATEQKSVENQESKAKSNK